MEANVFVISPYLIGCPSENESFIVQSPTDDQSLWLVSQVSQGLTARRNLDFGFPSYSGAAFGTANHIALPDTGKYYIFSDSDNTNTPSTIDHAGMIKAIGGASIFIFKGSIDASANPDYPAALAGDVYRISAAGKIGGAAGMPVAADDFMFAMIDTAGGSQAAVGAHWDVAEGVLTTIKQGGNSFGTNVIIGTVDAFDIELRANNETAAWVRKNRLTIEVQAGIDMGFGINLIRYDRGTNIAIGGNTISGSIPATQHNIAIGTNALSSVLAGAHNIAIGESALAGALTVQQSVAVGFQALINSTAGTNTAIGNTACQSMTTATGNTAIGMDALASVVDTNLNTAVGHQAGIGSTGHSNIYVGVNSFEVGPDTGNNNIFIGNGIDFPNAFANTIVIGVGTPFPTANNMTIIGAALSLNGFGIIPTASLHTWGDFSTGDPGSGVGKWKLGKKIAAASVLDAANYLEVMVDGVVYKVAIAV